MNVMLELANGTFPFLSFFALIATVNAIKYFGK
jgi:hypothetical protein